MCKWGDTISMELTIPAHLSCTGEARRKVIDVDRCIAPLVEALNAVGMTTIASCCGHGKQPGSIVLEGGREIRIMPDFESARAVDRLFPPINSTRELNNLEFEL